MPATSVLAVLVLVLGLGASACGKDATEPAPGPTPTVTAPTSSSPSATGGPSPGSSPTSPAVGLPTDFPAQSEVPVVSGVVTSKTGGKDEKGRIGYVIEMSAVGSKQACFERAAAALVAAGFTQRGEMTAGDTRQAQFTTERWAVIISARADGENCQLGYEVGQLTE